MEHNADEKYTLDILSYNLLEINYLAPRGIFLSKIGDFGALFSHGYLIYMP